MLKLILEIVGTVAFSASGAVVGIRKRMDIFGVISLGIFTAVGGGVIRDLIIGVTPPTAFRNPVYTLVAITVASVVFLPFIRRRIDLDHFIWVLIDSFGLGAFTMTGVSTGIPFDNLFLEVFLGVVTGIGGGVIRDICAGEIPMIYVRHFYACPCIIGALVCALLDDVSPDAAVVSGAVIIIVLRLLAAKYRWHLPKAD